MILSTFQHFDAEFRKYAIFPYSEFFLLNKRNFRDSRYISAFLFRIRKIDNIFLLFSIYHLKQKKSS